MSYNSRTNKNVLLLSTAHATENVNEDTGKPLLIHDYNQHKGGVDTFDKMLRAYTCKRRCTRWPMLMFFNMKDVAAQAVFRLFELSDPTWKRRGKRKRFLKDLALLLFFIAIFHLVGLTEYDLAGKTSENPQKRYNFL